MSFTNWRTSLGELLAGENLTDNVLQVTNKALASATAAWTNYNSGASLVGTAGLSIKASAGRLSQIRVVSTNATTKLYLVLCDKASAPVANDVAVASLSIAANTAASIFTDATLDFTGMGGKYFALGIAYAISTTPQKVTLPATADCSVTAEYA